MAVDRPALVSFVAGANAIAVEPRFESDFFGRDAALLRPVGAARRPYLPRRRRRPMAAVGLRVDRAPFPGAAGLFGVERHRIERGRSLPMALVQTPGVVLL